MVFVLNRNKKPLNACSYAKARILLKQGKAVVHKRFPFTIRLKVKIENSIISMHRMKYDPGARYTGVTIINKDVKEIKVNEEIKASQNVVFLGTIEHKSFLISSSLEKRSGVRHGRRARHTWYRRCKFPNKVGQKSKFNSSRPKGWLPPSVRSIVDNIVNITKKYRKLCPIDSVSIETVKFDIQLLNNPEISGVEYQQGSLFGYEVKEYLIERYGHNCMYCKAKVDKKIVNLSNDVILETEHMISKANGGSKRIKNLSIACHSCNQEKDSLNLDTWLEKLKNSKQSKLNIARIENITKLLENGLPKFNRDTARVNAYRYDIMNKLRELGLDLEISTGGRTKYNRIQLFSLPKEHYYDALSVGNLNPDVYKIAVGTKELYIKAMGRGSRKMSNVDKYGFTYGTPKLRQKIFYGFQTGDIVKADVLKGKYKGIHTGRIAVRSRKSFKFTCLKRKMVFDVNPDYCKVIQRSDGYNYNLKKLS
jgi:hypothetical protein